MEKLNYKMEGILWFFLLLPAIYLAYVWNALPETVPIHFDASGEPNGWGGKATEFVLIGAGFFVYFLMLLLRRIDPKNMNEGFFTNNYFKLRASLVIFLSIISVVVIHAALPDASHMALHWIPSLVFLLLAVLGNFMINLKPNWFIGIRTPWTLSNDVVWRKTHQVGGRIFFYGGLICVALTFLIKGAWLEGLILTFILGSALFLFGYSFWLFKQEQKGTPQ
jgi:immunity protein, SdpI family